MPLLQVCVCGRTNSLRGEDLREAGGEGDEHHGVRDPGQILEEHVAVQTPVHPLLCCGHTHTHTHTLQPADSQPTSEKNVIYFVISRQVKHFLI